MPQMLVRCFAPNDAAAVITLWDEVIPSSTPWNDHATTLQRKIDREDELMLVGELDGNIVATIVAGYDGIRGWIYRLVVAAEYRRRGYGRAMMLAAEKKLRESGCPKVNLQVRPDNLSVIAFYNRCGYTVEDRASLGKRLLPPPTSDTAKRIARSVEVAGAIRYQIETDLSAIEFIDVLKRSTLAERRPVNETATVEAMLRNAQLVVTARCDEQLVGVSRAISDFAYCTYLSDLAVDVEFQRRGIGGELIRRTHQFAGLNTTLILLSAPAAVDYYPRIGMQHAESCWITPRTN